VVVLAQPPSPALAGAAAGGAEAELVRLLLEDCGLGRFFGRLFELGADNLTLLGFVEDEELSGLGMTPLQQRVFRKKLASQ
jgi:hypothetical protein